MQQSLKGFILFICLCYFSNLKAQLDFGVSSTFITAPSEIGLGLGVDFPVHNEKIFGSISSHYFFTDNLIWDLNLDIQYQLLEINYGTVLRPIGGVHFATESTFQSTSNFDLGIQLGLFFKTPVSGDSKFFVETKYQILIDALNGLAFRTGILF